MVEEKLKRPLGLKLIIIYDILHLMFVFFSISAGYGGVVGILYIIALYYGLWKMRKDWMYVVIIGKLISTMGYSYFMFTYLSPLTLLFIILNIISIYWLYTNRNIFKEPEKGSALGTKSEWIRFGLIVLGIIIMFILGAINFEYLGYGILALPIWVIFVWFVVPRLMKKK
ncbi:MAG: hypothetical protein QXP52_03355 [Candidatus Aenigmatarchaeota archaeon]